MNKDILKNEEQAVFSLRSLYRQYGYLPFKMSKFEEFEYYIRNKDFLVSDRIITFNDTNGKLMALKPDVTLSIIKNGEDVPGVKQKVYYDENVYRVSDNTHQFKEIMQAGLECIGDIDLYDIFEAVSLAAKSLALISEDYVLQVSHLGVLSQALDSLCPDPTFRQEAIGFISRKNPHDLSRLCREYGVADTLLLSFVNAYGQRDRVLKQLEESGCNGQPMEELKALSALLDQLPLNDRIIFDFSVVNNISYYNGIVFRGYLSGICEGVLAGGQYDKLMQKLGRRSGAIGFALYLDLLEQLPAPKKEYHVDALVVYDPGVPMQTVAKTVDELVTQGKTVSTQKSIPAGLRYRQLVKLTKEGTAC